MTQPVLRIAINIGSGLLPGLDLVVAGAALAADRLDLELVGIRDGYDGLLYPDRYPDGGLVPLRPAMVDNVGHGGSLIGTAARTDPFRVRVSTADHEVEEVDRSDDILAGLRAAGIGAVISIVGGSAVTGLHALSVAFKLNRKGVRTACIPKSIENEIAGVPQAFGYNSVLSHTAETLERIRIGARDVGRLAVVEVPGQHAGWLALQSGIAAMADAILLPEIPHDLAAVAGALALRERAGHRCALVVVAEGARSAVGAAPSPPAPPGGLRASLTPNADPDFGEGAHVMDRTGGLAETVATALQRLTDREVLPFSLGHLVRGGPPSVLDRQLGLSYGAAAVRALHAGEDGIMVSYRPPDLGSVPLRETLGRIRTVPADGALIQTARALGIALGDEGGAQP
ncbi:6-phosphofructokinase [Roseomonas rosulenta]|uniref:6-phosphofructokinase n=1 Tax=Roseomonas rosulenta TaxID=2748667 RepID=UPI0018DEF05F|nr:6-phosphofructokinase [Roseomonas rosulenta]